MKGQGAAVRGKEVVEESSSFLNTVWLGVDRGTGVAPLGANEEHSASCKLIKQC